MATKKTAKKTTAKKKTAKKKASTSTAKKKAAKKKAPAKKTKNETGPADVVAYIAARPPDQRAALTHLRALIHKAAPDAKEQISYGMPMFKLNGHLVAFAGFDKYMTFFVCSATFLPAYKTELAGFKGSPSGVHFTADKPIPDALITKMVKARVAQNLAL